MDSSCQVLGIRDWVLEVGVALKFEELRVLQDAENVADSVWSHVLRWEPFARDVVGRQLARASDSIGANIAEAFGRFHYGEKLQFLYYARSSLCEAKYWLNRARSRSLIPDDQIQENSSQLTQLARQLNAFASNLKAQRQGCKPKSKAIREAGTEYNFETTPFICKAELEWLNT